MINLRVFGAYVNALQLHGAACGQQHVLCSDDGDERDHQPRAPSCDAHGACAHVDAHDRLGERARGARDVSWYASLFVMMFSSSAALHTSCRTSHLRHHGLCMTALLN